MIATITYQGASAARERSFSRSPNMAGAPLPLIPRRTPSASRIHSPASSPAGGHHLPTPPVRVVVEQPSPPQHGWPSMHQPDDSDSSSSSLSDGSRPTISIRAKRVRGTRVPAVRPPEHSTPTPTVFEARTDAAKSHQRHLRLTGGQDVAGKSGKSDDAVDTSTPRQSLPQPLIYTPGSGSLRLTVANMKTRHLSDPHIRAASESPVLARSTDIPSLRLVRKKSGQLVKSSLKSSKSARGGLSVMTMAPSSKSEPNTPTLKAVHFDAKLEHVKLFLAEQKPLAVSRDGSPTDDTSGTDSDFPSFIYGDSDNEQKAKRKSLIMEVANMPRKVNLNADVALEELTLCSDATSISGRVRVRNLAFAKWIAVRFTLDSWQTTSEVTAKYVESIDSDFDRFSFSIRLTDLLPRIEGKTLYLALRYTVCGREIWDNNGGQNYLATFTKAKPCPEKPKSSDSDSSVGKDIDDLRSKLEKVVQGKDKEGSGFVAHQNRRGLLEHEQSPLPMFRKTDTSLASRYDLATSLRSPWKPTPSPSPPKHVRAQSHPNASTPSSELISVPWPQKSAQATPDKSFTSRMTFMTSQPALGSPRDLDVGSFHPVPYTIDLDDPPFAIPSREQIVRNHQLGYFESDDFFRSSELDPRKILPETPRIRSLDDMSLVISPPRSFSFPPDDSAHSGPPFGLGLSARARTVQPMFTESSEEEQSTPSIVSSTSSSRSTSPVLTDSYMMNKLAEQIGETLGPDTNYHQFLNKFCFYTGPDAMSPEKLSQTLSDSDLEDFFSGTSPHLHALSQHILMTPPRSSALDDDGTRSGSSTPTGPKYTPDSPRSTTPVAGY